MDSELPIPGDQISASVKNALGLTVTYVAGTYVASLTKHRVTEAYLAYNLREERITRRKQWPIQLKLCVEEFNLKKCFSAIIYFST